MASVNEDKELLRYAGDFRLELCNIISYRTDPDNATESLRINILPQLMGLSIVEDISMECITGEVDLAEAQDIMDSEVTLDMKISRFFWNSRQKSGKFQKKT